MIPSRLARALVALFPASFRDEYGPDLLHLFAEQWTEPGIGFRRRAGLILDLLTSAAREWKGELAAPGRAQRRRLDVLILDLKHQLRWLARTPAFAVSALLTLALGVGIATAIFAVFHGVLLQPLPFREPDRLAFITRSGDVSISDGVDWRARSRSWESMALFARNWGWISPARAIPRRSRSTPSSRISSGSWASIRCSAASSAQRTIGSAVPRSSS